MRILTLGAAAMAVLITGCAASPELISCLQPNRRVAVEVAGFKVKAPKTPGGKPGKDNVLLKGMAQGDLAFDPNSAVLKAGGMTDMDKMVKTITQGTRRDKRPIDIGSIVIYGYSDRLEVEDGHKDLDVKRAESVKNYLVKKGLKEDQMFWEGRDAKDPVPVTQYCD